MQLAIWVLNYFSGRCKHHKKTKLQRKTKRKFCELKEITSNISSNIIVIILFVPVPIVDGSVLNLVKVSRLDMGAYLCVASNGVPPAVSKRIHLGIDCECIYYSKEKGHSPNWIHISGLSFQFLRWCGYRPNRSVQCGEPPGPSWPALSKLTRRHWHSGKRTGGWSSMEAGSGWTLTEEHPVTRSASKF